MRYSKDQLKMLDAFSEYLLSLNRAKRTVENYEAVVKEFYEIGEDCRGYLQELYNRGNSPNTRSNKYYALKSWVEFLRSSGVMVPKLNTPAPKREEPIPEILSKEEIERMLDKCDTETLSGLRALALLSFLVETGCRISEALGIRMGYKARRYTHIDAEGADYIVIFRNTKTHHERKNYLSRTLVEDILYRYWEAKKETEVPESKYLFSEIFNNDQLSRNAAWAIIRNLGEEAGLTKRAHPHIFRDTKATRLVEEGIQPNQICAQMGFKDVNRIRVYYHISKRVLKKALKTPVVDLEEYFKKRRKVNQTGQ